MTARIAVVGSALTRSALVADPRLSVPAGHFLARVSMAGLGTPPVEDADLTGVASDFRRELVRRDVDRMLVADLVRLDPDAIVVDVADERFALDVLPSGAVVTVSPEYLESAPPQDGRRRVPSGDEEHLALWVAGWRTFLSTLDAVGLRERLILHHGGMAVRTADGTPARHEAAILAAARYADRLADRAAQDLDPARVVRVDDAIRHAAPADDGTADPLALAPAAAAALAAGVVAVLDGRDPWEVDGLVDVSPDAEPAECAAPQAHAEPAAPQAPAESAAPEPSAPHRDVVESDYANYGVDPVRWESAEEFAASGFGPGLHILPLPDGNHLDLIIRGDLGGVGERHSVVVFLTGAMSQRNSVAPPFFAGRRLSYELGIPWVAVSDPSMQLADDLLLGWYTGSPGSQAHATLLAALRALADGLGRDLLLVGGSGGGFAALRLNEELEGRSSVFAWNPQTDLLDYHPPAVRDYLRTLFPGEELDPVAEREAVEARLAEEGIGHRVGTLDAGRRVVVFQNAGDHHVEGHLLPLVHRTPGMTGGPRRFATDAEHQVRIATWGAGHAALPAHVTARAVDAMRRGHSASTVATDIDALLAHERGDDSDGPDVLVTAEPGGLSRVDWAAFPGEADDGHACTLSRMHGEDVVDQVEHIGPPVVLPRLDEGEHWRLEAFDARGRRVHEIHVDGRGDPVPSGGMGGSARPRRARQ